MNKLWWFNLYSIHVIKHALKWTGIGLVLDQISSRSGMMDSWGSGFVFLSFYPLIRGTLSKDFRSNIEFHKMSVPFKELKQAFFIHHVLIFICSYVLFLLSYNFSRFGGGVHSHIQFDVLNYFNSSSILFLHFSVFVIYLCLSQMDLLKRKYQFFSEKKSEFIRFIYGAITSALFTVCCFSLMMLTGNEILPLLFLGSSFAFASWLYVNKAIFHQVPEKATIMSNLKYGLIGAVTFCGIYFLCLGIGRNDVLDSSLSVEKRISSFKFNGWLNPEIDIETFKIIEPQIDFILTGDEILYSQLSFDPSIVGVDHFVTGPNVETRLLSFLRLGKPSPKFLVSLYDHYEKHPDLWEKSKYQHQIKYLSFIKWPKTEQLPERFVVAKQTASELYNNSKLPKSKRLPASGK